MKIIYADIPDFDQETQYIVQLPREIINSDTIYYGIKIMEVETKLIKGGE